MVFLHTRVNVDTLIDMERVYAWDEAKRQQNLSKHGLDFLDADLVLESPYRLEVDSERSGERRRQAFAYVSEVLTVLTVVYLPGDTLRIISFRPANRREREKYHEWLEIDREVE
ncbi:BrnT family toxin [Thioalkalivibrio sp.]|uniref:BrnT family toxin n=1 Tax=Thioalkalivibrio sp. TaxID=2093813 RepID=UPI00397662BD